MFKELRGIESMKKGGKECWEILRNIHDRWLVSVIPALWRLREEERKVKISPSFRGIYFFLKKKKKFVTTKYNHM